jgi:hypothetical protein
MGRLTEEDIAELTELHGETFIPDEEQESKRKKKKKPLIEPEYRFNEWKPGMFDRFGEIP